MEEEEDAGEGKSGNRFSRIVFRKSEATTKLHNGASRFLLVLLVTSVRENFRRIDKSYSYLSANTGIIVAARRAG